MVSLRSLSNLRRTLEIPLINCEISLSLTLSSNWVISSAAANQTTAFAITNIKLYVPVVTLSTQDDKKVLQQLKLGINTFATEVFSAVFPQDGGTFAPWTPIP